MDSTQIFWMQILTSAVVFGIVAVWYVRPYLTTLPRDSALIPLLFVQVPRYVGMTLFVGYMVDPKLPREFVSNAAYGDLAEAALAFASIFALRSNWRFAIPLVWVTTTWGFVDLLNGLRGVVQLNVQSFNLGTFWYVYTFYAPLVLVAHLMLAPDCASTAIPHATVRTYRARASGSASAGRSPSDLKRLSRFRNSTLAALRRSARSRRTASASSAQGKLQLSTRHPGGCGFVV